MTPFDQFVASLHTKSSPRVLELGTRQWVPGVSTHHGRIMPHDGTHVMSDVQEGRDVDVVADAHDLEPFSDEEFDALIAVSVWEHLRKPWIAADSAARILKPGGIIYIQTHFSFPVHGYPSDYGRWTDEGLKALFDKPTWIDQSAELSYPCTITPPEEITVWNDQAPAYLNVAIFARKA